MIRWDEPVYLLLGKNIWSGLGFTFNGHPELHHSPLFPFLAGATLELTGRPETASNIWYVLLGTLLTLPVYGLARRLTSHAGAMLAAALVAFFPALTTAVLYWGTIDGAPVPLPDLHGGVPLVSRPGRRETLLFAVAGALTGLAYLARPRGSCGWPRSTARRCSCGRCAGGAKDWRTLAALAPPNPLSQPPPRRERGGSG